MRNKKFVKLDKVAAEHKAEFYNVYHKNIAPIFMTFEKKRIERLWILGFCMFCCVGLGLVLLSFIAQSILPYELLTTCLFIDFILLVTLPIKFNRNFTKQLKQSCMHGVIKTFKGFHWENGCNMLIDGELVSSKLFSTYNRRSNDDSFKGNYRGVDVKISETSLLYESGSGRNRSVQVVFKGVIINFATNRKIKNTTVIATKGDFNTGVSDVAAWLVLLPIWANLVIMFIDKLFLCAIITVVFVGLLFAVKYLKIGKSEQLQKMNLEDPEFNKRYKAYSSNQIEGRYLVTPAFMERFKNIETAFGSKDVKCSFYGDSLMFAISTNKNLFEIGNLYHNLLNPKQMETFFYEFYSILSLVDYFKLDEKTKL